MSSIIDKPLTLALNANWLPIGTRSIRAAIVAMNSDPKNTDVAAHGLDIQYKQNEDGSYDFSQPIAMIPITSWAEWIELPILPHHNSITTPNMIIRAPTVVIAINYKKMPNKTFRVSKRTLFERDGGRCCYTGRPLSFNEATIEHIQPRSKGGLNTFENTAICDPNVNFKKGDKTLAESGLTLKVKPKAPPSVPIMELIKDCRHQDWSWFLKKK